MPTLFRLICMLSIVVESWLVVANPGPAASFVTSIPLPGARLVSAHTTIALRASMPMNPASIPLASMVVSATGSGQHAGRVGLSDDHLTLLFTPTQPFLPADTVQVTLAAGLRTTTGLTLPDQRFAFTVAPAAPAMPSLETFIKAQLAADRSLPRTNLSAIVRSSTQIDRTGLPADFPVISATIGSAAAASGDLFLSIFSLQ